jgi:DNA-binding transcriptional regulator YdaS (Cro superfamily)
MLNLRARTLARAAVILGSVERLAEELAISPKMLGRYIRGESFVPPEIFLRATEIITDGAVVDAAKPQKPTPKRPQ